MDKISINSTTGMPVFDDVYVDSPFVVDLIY